MTTTGKTIALNLEAREAEVLKNALRSFASDFGHDEADVLHEIQRLLAKVESATQPPAS